MNVADFPFFPLPLGLCLVVGALELMSWNLDGGCLALQDFLGLAEVNWSTEAGGGGGTVKLSRSVSS